MSSSFAVPKKNKTPSLWPGRAVHFVIPAAPLAPLSRLHPPEHCRALQRD